MQKLKDYAQIASDKLQGKNVTCAGCIYRIIFLDNSFWTEHCVKETHVPQSHGDYRSICETSPEFKQICPLFKGRPVSLTIGPPDYQLFRPDNGGRRIYALDAPEAYEAAILPFSRSIKMEDIRKISQ
jgi:hypothetical protein